LFKRDRDTERDKERKRKKHRSYNLIPDKASCTVGFLTLGTTNNSSHRNPVEKDSSVCCRMLDWILPALIPL
jgi:hypothetical protein